MASRTGAPLSCSSEAAAQHYAKGIDLILGSETGAAEQLDQALALDEQFALAAAARYLLAKDSQDPAAASYRVRATESVKNASAWEQQHISALFGLIEAPYANLAQTEAYLKTAPCDLLVMSQLCGYLIFYGGPSKIERVLNLLETAYPHLKEDWAYLSRLGFAASEAGDYHRGRMLIEQALAIRPQALYSIHGLAHVLHDMNSPEESAQQLINWLTAHEATARAGQMYGHVQWHLALAEWQLGQRDTALARYHRYCAPNTTTCGPVLTLADCGGFLLREFLATGETTALPAEVSEHMKKFEAMLAHPFIALHIGGLYASAGDTDGLERCTETVATADADNNRDIALTLLSALTNFVRQEYQATVNQLNTISPAQRVGVGGSRVERILIDLLEQRAQALA
ncbi:hypothetical protein ACFVYJ_02980 [Pontibacter sp. JAM-7]|uniref:hypothetical protein n=1 Tax=Pontibacter sp. JAM-7 TaxID=3366581 RepID=UPI003AF88662